MRNFALLFILSFGIAWAPYTRAEDATASLEVLAADFARLRERDHTFVAEIDGQRFVNTDDWSDDADKPWLFYGENDFSSWKSAAQWILDDADGIPLSEELYDMIERRAMQGHYYRGFETRRIISDGVAGRLEPQVQDKLLASIAAGEKIYYSGVDHASLVASYRQDSKDEFVHHGEGKFKNGERFLSKREIENARKNPLLLVDEDSIRHLGFGRYSGNIYYPRIKDLKRLVKEALAKYENANAAATSLADRVHAILDLRTELITIHRSLDGNGRVIRLLADLLFMRAGLPPPAFPLEGDIFGDREENFRQTIQDMKVYFKKMEFFRLRPEVPKYLYHWTTEGSFKWMMDNRPSVRSAPMQTIEPLAWLAYMYPWLKNRQGTHAWIDPLSAMRGGDLDGGPEWYAKPEKQPVLIRYLIDPTAKVAYVRTVEKKNPRALDKKSFGNADLIFHIHTDFRGAVEYQEWVILNPAVVRMWSASPDQLKPAIHSEREWLNELGKYYPDAGKHYILRQPNPAAETQEVDMIERFLKGPDNAWGVCDPALLGYMK